jgi:NADH:ubiquinone oxidoreductase subunit 6 (subunit J)
VTALAKPSLVTGTAVVLLAGGALLVASVFVLSDAPWVLATAVLTTIGDVLAFVVRQAFLLQLHRQDASRSRVVGGNPC